MSLLYPSLGCFNPDTFTVYGRLQYNGAGVPTLIKGKGVKSITDDGAGLFTVEVDHPWSHMLQAGGHRESVAAVGGGVQFIKGTDVVATRKLSYRIIGDADAVEDPANGDGCSFFAVLQKSGLPAV